MAKYEDYVKPTEDGIETEIEQASEAQTERATTAVPESVAKRFAGKSSEDIMNSYANLEQKLSEQGQKMGDLRKSFDDYVVLQSQPSEPEPAPEPVTADDLYEEPDNAIARVVQRETGDKLKELETELQAARRERAIATFERSHPEARETAQTAEFVEWVQASPYRVRLAGKADSYDLDAAEELFGLYGDSTQAHETVEQRVKRETDLRNASLETSGPEYSESEVQFSRAEVIDYKLRAKLGDREAQVWLTKNAEDIAIAYEEGNLID